MKKSRFAILFSMILLCFLACGCSVQEDIPDASEQSEQTITEEIETGEQIVFEDPVFERAIKKMLGKDKLYQSDLDNVTSITIRNNKKLKTITDLAKFKSVKNVSLVDCSINKIEFSEEIESLKSVTALVLSGNKIHDLAFLRYFPNLWKLDVYNNELENVKGIEQCTRLQKVELRENRIVDGKELKSLEKLHTIGVDDEFDRTQLDFMIGNFRTADVKTKQYLLAKQYNLEMTE